MEHLWEPFCWQTPLCMQALGSSQRVRNPQIKSLSWCTEEVTSELMILAALWGQSAGASPPAGFTIAALAGDKGSSPFLQAAVGQV